MCSYTFIGVADLFHFDTDPFRGKTDPDPASDPTENRKISNFFLLITKKMIYYLMNIDDIKLFFIHLWLKNNQVFVIWYFSMPFCWF